MAAQPGNSTLLEYKAQGSRQNGAGTILDYTDEDEGPTVVRLSAGLTGAWAHPKSGDQDTVGQYPDPINQDLQQREPWATIGPLASNEPNFRWPYNNSAALDSQYRYPWGKYTGRIEQEESNVWSHTTPSDRERYNLWGGPMLVLDDEFYGRFLASKPRDQEKLYPWGGPMLVLTKTLTGSWIISVKRDLEQWVPWTRFSRLIDSSWGVPTPPNEDEPPAGAILVPIRRVYRVLNEVKLFRVDDSRELPISSMNMSLDVDSWTWQFSASLAGKYLGLIWSDDVGSPVEVKASVNGVDYRMIIEAIVSDRSLGSHGLSLRGRGRSAVLDAPYAPVLSFGDSGSLTAQQQIEAILSDNGIPIGWDLEFNLDDWLIPGSTWGMRSTYMPAINDIVNAAGGYVQPHKVDQKLRILKRYPTLPWTWDNTFVPDITLPSAPVTREGIEWVTRPDYNRVFVMGQTNGIIGQVTRAGTDGSILAPDIVHPVITNTIPARTRGEAELANTGKIAMLTLRLPVLPETGLMEPGQMVRFEDGSVYRLGIVRSVSLASQSMTDVWQTIQVETHIYE